MEPRQSFGIITLVKLPRSPYNGEVNSVGGMFDVYTFFVSALYHCLG